MIGDRICELRKDRGMTQQHLADYLGIASSSVSNYENGLNAPSVDVVIKLADLFDVSADYILCRTKGKYNPNLDHSSNSELTNKIFDVLKGYKITKR